MFAGRKQAITLEHFMPKMHLFTCPQDHLRFYLNTRTGVHFMTITDAQARDAANRLGSQGIPTTPSGAAGLAGLKAFGEVERPLIIVTEGAV